ncbi:MAG: haloacid dehalogenase type II [Pseudomonadota bacterium]
MSNTAEPDGGASGGRLFPVYVFDAYGTLFDVHSAAARHAETIGPQWQQMSQVWRQKHLEYTWIYAQTGRHCSFWSLTQASLDTAIATIGGGVSTETRAALLDAYRSLSAYEEVAEVLTALCSAGAKCAILTNGDPAMIDAAIDSAGLTGKLDAVLTVHDIGVFKPDQRVYRLVCDRFACTPDDVSFQSSNRWDAVGANVFGFKTLWVNRSGAPAEYPETPPNRTAANLRVLLDDVAHAAG